MEVCRLVRSTAIAGAAGLACGVVYSVLLWLTEGSLRALGSVGVDGYWCWLGPEGFFLLLSVLYGLGAVWLAERLCGVSGAVLWVPVSAGTLCALGAGLGLSRLVLGPLPPNTGELFTACAVTVAATAALRITLSGRA